MLGSSNLCSLNGSNVSKRRRFIPKTTSFWDIRAIRVMKIWATEHCCRNKWVNKCDNFSRLVIEPKLVRKSLFSLSSFYFQEIFSKPVLYFFSSFPNSFLYAFFIINFLKFLKFGRTEYSFESGAIWIHMKSLWSWMRKIELLESLSSLKT